jgi:hypothetical protein
VKDPVFSMASPVTNGSSISVTAPRLQAWPPAVQHEVALKLAWAVIVASLGLWGVAIGFLWVPEELTVRACVVAGVIAVKAGVLTRIGMRMHGLAGGHGRRRRS